MVKLNTILSENRPSCQFVMRFFGSKFERKKEKTISSRKNSISAKSKYISILNSLLPTQINSAQVRRRPTTALSADSPSTSLRCRGRQPSCSMAFRNAAAPSSAIGGSYRRRNAFDICIRRSCAYEPARLTVCWEGNCVK